MPTVPASPTRTPLEFYTLLRDTGVMVTDELLALRQRDIAEVEAQTPANEPVPNYIIQVASFARLGDAETLRAQLILEGLTSTHLVRADLGEQGQFHRVMVGPVQGLGSAQAIAASLEQLGLQGMVRQQPNTP
jgi:cell division protein FtsN